MNTNCIRPHKFSTGSFRRAPGFGLVWLPKKSIRAGFLQHGHSCRCGFHPTAGANVRPTHFDLRIRRRGIIFSGILSIAPADCTIAARSGFGMRKSIHPLRAPRRHCQVSFLALLLLAGCGKSHSLYAQKEPENPHSATITWTASASRVAGYNVYRESQSTPPVKLTNGLVSGTRYTDKTVEAGRTYSYFVKSVDSKGVESGPSEKITVTIPTTVTPPAKN
jgi:hypothetical protein